MSDPMQDLAQQVQWLQNELQDAHLVIGQQHVQILKLQQALQQRQSQEVASVASGNGNDDNDQLRQPSVPRKRTRSR